MSAAFPSGHSHGRHIQHPKVLSTSSRSGNPVSPCKGSRQPDRRAHASAIAADSLAKALCWVFYLQPLSLPVLGDSAPPQRRNSPTSFTKAAAVSSRESQDVPPHSRMGFWGTKDTLSQSPTASLVQGQHSGFCLHGAGRRCLIKPVWGISQGRNLAVTPGAGRRVTVLPRNGWAPGREQRSLIQVQLLSQKWPEPAHI